MGGNEWKQMRLCADEHKHLCAFPCWWYANNKFSHQCTDPVIHIHTGTHTPNVIKHSLLLSHSHTQTNQTHHYIVKVISEQPTHYTVHADY